MKKLALASGLAVYVIFGASYVSLAADRADNSGRVGSASRDSRPASAVIGTNSRLLFVNQALYPDTSASDTAIAASAAAHGAQERADMAVSVTSRTDLQLLFVNEALYPDTSANDSAITASASAHGDQERADMAQPDTTSTDTQRMFCDGDICIVP
jgi:hypothetical protein